LGQLSVPGNLIKDLESRGIKVHVAKTKKAVSIYNQLCDEEQRAGILIHSTC